MQLNKYSLMMILPKGVSETKRWLSELHWLLSVERKHHFTVKLLIISIETTSAFSLLTLEGQTLGWWMSFFMNFSRIWMLWGFLVWHTSLILHWSKSSGLADWGEVSPLQERELKGVLQGKDHTPQSPKEGLWQFIGGESPSFSYVTHSILVIFSSIRNI